MCELLGMSANVPTDICFSFTGLIQRGGNTGPHKDGWGIVFYEHKGIREFRDYNPCCDSKIAQLVQQLPIKSEVVISHIRQANVGDISLENTHPFTRELRGKPWTFAHNGQLNDYHPKFSFYQPIGTTDSESAFCEILDQIRNAGPTIQDKLHELATLIINFCLKRHKQGVFNMILSQGDYLICFCSTKLCWITRKAPFGEACLSDAEMVVNFQGETTPNDIVSIITTRPLTDNEEWHMMKPGEMRIFKAGETIWQNSF